MGIDMGPNFAGVPGLPSLPGGLSSIPDVPGTAPGRRPGVLGTYGRVQNIWAVPRLL